MSTLSNLSNYGTDYQIGEVVNVLTGDINSETSLLLSSGGFVPTGAVYAQSDYPQLYAKLGAIGDTSLYNPATQFYVPEATASSLPLTASGWVAPRTGAQWKSYIRAK